MLSLLEDRQLPRNLILSDAVRSTRDISRDPTGAWLVDLENGKNIGALDVQWQFHELAQRYLAGRDAETDWLLESWSFTLEALEQNQETLIGGVDWITKKMAASKRLSRRRKSIGAIRGFLASTWNTSNIDNGLFFSVTPGKRIGEWNNSIRPGNALRAPPANTRASGRARAVAYFQDRQQPYVINWDSIAHDSRDFLVMGDPFQPYDDDVETFLAKPRPPANEDED